MRVKVLGGSVATPSYNLLAFLVPERTVRARCQLLLVPFSLGPSATSSGVEDKPGISILGFALRPTTESRVHLTSADPLVPPRVEAHYLETAEDRDISIRMFRRMRELVASDPIASDIAAEITPGPIVDTDDDEMILRSGFLNGGTGYHASGACAMGPDESDAIDSRLRVRGVDGLRVVDVSILPTMVAGNLNAPMMAMAYRASEMILEDR